MPEGLSAFRAARANRLQTSLNLALGSALASIGLTIPVVSLVSVYVGKSLTMGLDPEHIVLLMLTLFAGTLTLATGRTTVLQGGVHMVIFAAFLVIAAIPLSDAAAGRDGDGPARTPVSGRWRAATLPRAAFTRARLCFAESRGDLRRALCGVRCGLNGWKCTENSHAKYWTPTAN